MRKFLIAAVVAATVGSMTTTVVEAQGPIGNRIQRNVRQLERQAQRAVNRSTYFNDNSWKQVSPWVDKYSLQTSRAVGNVVGDAARATADATRAAANAVRTTADATTKAATNAAANARFGYANPKASNAANVWFYDYYQLPPTYYSTVEGNAAVYSSATQYRDTNEDGVYDGLYSYRDSDNDGVYDEYDHINFAESNEHQENATANDDESVAKTPVDTDAVYDAKRHSVEGKVEATKLAKVNGQSHTIVKVKGEKDSLIVDLGASSELSELKIEEGTEISASGPMIQVGEKDVLVADKVTVENKEVVIARHAPRLTGSVLETNSASAQKNDHVMAVIETDHGNQLVDLGSANHFEMTLEPKTEVVLWGAPVQMRDHSVILAEKVQVNGKTYSIKRW